MRLCQPSRWLLIRTAAAFSGRKPLPLEILEQGLNLTDVPTFKISKLAAKPADLLKHNLEKMKKTTLYPDVAKIALNGRYQGGFEIAYKRRQIKWDA
ncbi:hypothetical protein T10_10143 [Trichinella papuae]|uniref:Uncharacterized protein n=1 Tax=Trichinella papuae TaxID=268474 RepID=A0A0V1M220_9BILA|nr:hypothetical protein T10_10143 [Trichinella papuae]